MKASQKFRGHRNSVLLMKASGMTSSSDNLLPEGEAFRPGRRAREEAGANGSSSADVGCDTGEVSAEKCETEADAEADAVVDEVVEAAANELAQ